MVVSIRHVIGAASRPGTVSVVPGTVGAAAPTVILLPGDVSTSREVMLRSTFLRKWSRWSCEDLALLLSRRWPACNAVVIHPPRSMDGFSCYEGWLEHLTETGDPSTGYGDSGASGSACAHLLAHLAQVPDVCSSSSPLHLIGFSKGTVPLNQLLAEIGSAGEDGEAATGDSSSPAAELLRRVDSMVWLDPGLNVEPGPILLGGTHADAELLRAAARRMRARTPRPTRLAVALTPYQMQPQGWLRSWAFVWTSWPFLRRESNALGMRRRFERLLRREGVALACEDCLMDWPPSLENHFEVLNAFTAAPWAHERDGEEDGGSCGS